MSQDITQLQPSLEQAKKEALDRAVDAASGVSKLAVRLDISANVVSNWRMRGGVPAEWCIRVEMAVDAAVTRYDLRPDVFGPAPVEKFDAA